MSSKIVSGSADNTIKIWEINDINNDSQIINSLATLDKHSGSVICLEFLKNDRLASGSADTTILIWNLKDFSCIDEFCGHWGSIECLCGFNGQDNDKIISGSSDKTIKVWDLKTKECVHTLIGHTDWITSLQILKNTYLMSGAGLFSTIIWDLNTGNLLIHLKGQHYLNGFHHKVQILSNDVLVFGGDDFTLKMWDLIEKAKILSIDEMISKKNSYEDQIISFENDNIKTYELNQFFNGSKTHKDFILSGHTNVITSIQILSNTRLASGSADNTVKIWDLPNRDCIQTLSGHSDSISKIAMIYEDRLASSSLDNSIRIWNLNNGECLKKLEGHTGHVTCFKVIR